jgi:DNA-binding response OmpR family regulator
MTTPKILVVDNDDAGRTLLQEELQSDGFDVVAAANVRTALKHIASEDFDVLLSDLYVPLPGDGFTVVGAMRHTHPNALTVILSDDPPQDGAISANLSQADEILTKPIPIGAIKELISTRLTSPRPAKRVKAESVASILERETETTIQNWLTLVNTDAKLTSIALSHDQRSGHLPKLLDDLIVRLRLDSGLPASISIAAHDHGELRCKQGYTAAMIVEESRILQVSIFSTLRNNLRTVEFSKLLRDVVVIADEVDSQLRQAMHSYDPEWVKAKEPRRVQRDVP